jgi:hypothetical protein
VADVPTESVTTFSSCASPICAANIRLDRISIVRFMSSDLISFRPRWPIMLVWRECLEVVTAESKKEEKSSCI